ncbi:methyltransferase domain-containing protein [Actinomadura hibisca]|uniref:methyltransferase domain-containing protein n=1 Tax=Actinomadura hibisca TaxID=68565 RepID=UPI00082AE338|nr:methyltransferase domain-containing protein [Actinomadura hibisca]
MTVRDAFDAVPRRLFLPEVIWVRQEDGWAVPLRRGDAPEQWEQACAADDTVITQVDDGAATDRGLWATSSSSAPGLMARMLEELRVVRGSRVLEIGTGTGYNAALLAHLTGADNITTVEIDDGIAAQARQALDQAGYPVEVVTGDGALGHPKNAPYDRVIATAAVHEVPYAWVEQTRPGGLILVPWALTVHPEAPFALLEVREDGTAEGRFVAASGFMTLRAQRVSQEDIRHADEAWAQAGRPEIARHGVTVTPAGQTVWLDSPANPVSYGLTR